MNTDPRRRLFSMGHSNHSWERFIGLLGHAGITAVVDVRSQPFSRRYPQFDRHSLRRGLQEQDIVYVFCGDSLGGRPQQPSLYDEHGRVNYDRVRRTPAFQGGLDQVCAALEQFRLALVCSEEDPLDCHRGLMIAPALVERGLTFWHIRADGSIESTSEIEARLLTETKVGVGILDGLFADTLTAEERGQMLEEAYRIQARRKAFRFRQDETSGESEEFTAE